MAVPLSVVELGRIFWLRTDKANLKGFCPVSLRLTLRGHRPVEVSTGVRCRAADWAGPTGKQSPLKKSHLEYAIDSQTLETLRLNVKIATKRLEALGEAATPATVAHLLKHPAALTPQPDPCLLAFMEGELETAYKAGNRATYEAMRAIVRKLRSWHGPTALPLKAFPPVRVLAFYQQLLQATARGGEIRTANKAIINLTAMYRRGVKQHKWPLADNPFACVDKKKDLKRQKVRLTADEHRAVATLPLDPASWLWRAQAVYLLQFFLRGERVGACLLLKWKDLYQNGTCLRYQAQKGGPFKQVPVRPELAALLADLRTRYTAGHVFILPFLPDNYDKLDTTKQLDEVKKATAVINKALKEVAKRAGVDKPLRSHAARHTFATVAAKAVGARAVQQMLGHTTLKMTETYLASLDNDEMDSAADVAFDSLSLVPPKPPPVRYYSREKRQGLPRADPLVYTPQMLHTGRELTFLPPSLSL